MDAEVEHYVDDVEFVVPVRIAADAKPGAASLKVSAHFQSCNERICLPPKTVTLEQPIKIAPK